MKSVIVFSLGMIISAFAVAEAQIIQGIITDKNREPVEYATIVLQTPDSLYLNSTYSDSTGKFRLPVEIPAYRLIVQHLLYETYEKNYLNEYEVVIELTEKENQLGEVVIRGERPVMKFTDGKMTYNMPLLLSGKVVSSAYEAILQLPGVHEQNDMPVLAGTAGVTVLINGQVTSMPLENLMAALKTVPADKIQSAEIMYSAPPQYHIRGAAINLILNDQTANDGLQGQINSTYLQKHYANHTSGLSLLLPANKLTADFNYAFNLNQARRDIEIHSNHLYNSIINPIEQFNRGDKKSNEHHIRLGMDYRLTQNNRLNLTYTSQITTGIDNNEFSNGDFSHSENHKENDSPIQLHNVIANYSSGFGMKTGIEYTSYRNRTNQHFTERKTGKETEFMTDARQQIDRYRFFVDQSNALTAGWTLNYGGQYMYASDNSSQVYRSLTNSDLSGMDMKNLIKEYTTNVYVGFEKNFGQKLSLSASLSGEYYEIGDFDEMTVFPALEMTYFLSPAQIMQLSFSSDKVYPAYWEMHGAISYMNGYSEVHGNPQLRPYKDYSAQFNYMLKNKYILTAFYNYLDAYSVQLPYQATDRLALIYQTTNFDYKQTAGFSLIVPFTLRQVVNSRLALTGFYDKVKSKHFHDISFTNDRYVFYTRLDNTIRLSSKPDIKLEVDGAYASKNIQGPAVLTTLWSLDTGLKWTFFHNMAELRLKGTDLFNSWAPDMLLKYNTQNLRMNSLPDSRAVSLSFVFKFGGYDKTHKEVDSSRFGN